MDTLLSWIMTVMAFSCAFSVAFVDYNDATRLNVNVSSEVADEKRVTESSSFSLLNSSARHLDAGKGIKVQHSKSYVTEYNLNSQNDISEVQRPKTDAEAQDIYVIRNNFEDQYEFNRNLGAEAVNSVSSDNHGYGDPTERLVHSVVKNSLNMFSQYRSQQKISEGNDDSQSLYQLTDNENLQNYSDTRIDDYTDYDNEESQASSKTGDFFSEFNHAVATGLASLIIKPFTSIVKPFLVTPWKTFLKPIVSQYRSPGQVSSNAQSYTNCCVDCAGSMECIDLCNESNCMPTQQCGAAGEGAYAAYCQNKCEKGIISGQSLLPDYIPIEACRGLCAAGVQKLCKQQSCMDFGCYVEECQDLAPAGCG